MCIADFGPLGRTNSFCPVRWVQAPSAVKDAAGFRLGLSLFRLLIAVLFATGIAEAHPVSQGAMEVVIFPDRIAVRATVSSEEVLVAAAFGGQKTSLPLEAVRGHGNYLLAHLKVTADGRLLVGRVVEAPKQAFGRPSYALEYPLTQGAPTRVEFRQDVLREFEFAPGNPWEASYLVRIAQEGRPAAEGLLLTSKEPLIFDDRRHAGGSVLAAAGMAGPFVRHGVTHILTGYDHLLFVTALVLAVTSLWDLLKVITAFTLAHTITLALAALDLFRLPATIVEPMIAASIVVVAIQNVFWPKRSQGRSRLLVAFVFGLFHGLGFAGGLLDAMTDMQASGAAAAIAAFSVGVEIGHQLVVAPAYCAMRVLHRAQLAKTRPECFVKRYGSALISVAGMIYLVAALREASP